MSTAMDAPQEQTQKANNALALLRKAIERAQEDALYGDVTIRVSMQNGKIGHVERTVKETYK